MRKMINRELYCVGGTFICLNGAGFIKICISGGPLERMDALELGEFFGESAVKYWGKSLRFAVKYYPKTNAISGELTFNNKIVEEIALSDEEQQFFFKMIDRYSIEMSGESIMMVGNHLK